MRLLRSVFIFLTLYSVAAHSADFSLARMYPKETAHYDAMCSQVQNKVVPGLNLDPDAAANPNDCDDLYYAPGGVPDYQAAHACALRENDRLVLMMLYANGHGLPRDIPAALKIACVSTDGAPAEIWGRADHLAAMLTEKSPAEFDECDDITSGAAEGYCAGISESFEDVKRARRKTSLIKHWSSSDKVALAALERAKKSYIDKHTEDEVDASGTGHLADWISETAAQNDLFLEMLTVLERGTAAVETESDFERADLALNKTYQTTQHLPSGSLEYLGTITPQKIREAQRAWLTYRDAWVAFASHRYPSVSSATVKTHLTNERIALLSSIVESVAAK